MYKPYGDLTHTVDRTTRGQKKTIKLIYKFRTQLFVDWTS
jgi:hypothetical protein